MGSNASHYIPAVIRTFRRKGLERYFTKSERRGINAKQADRIRRILDRLDAAVKPEDLNLPGFKFHRLTGARKGTYSVWVSGNWRVTFEFEADNAINVKLEDYH